MERLRSGKEGSRRQCCHERLDEEIIAEEHGAVDAIPMRDRVAAVPEQAAVPLVTREIVGTQALQHGMSMPQPHIARFRVRVQASHGEEACGDNCCRR